MKNNILQIAVGLLMICGVSDTKTYSQNIYPSSGGEIIFSFADVESNGLSIKSDMRFTCWFHSEQLVNFDVNDNLGFYSGIGFRNIGINFVPDDTTFIKRRSYSAGIPIAFKLGSFDKAYFLFGGAEFELMFHYKQKIFINDKKEDKETEWFSEHTNLFNPSLFVGIQFPKGINVRFKYYLFDFLNQDYTEEIDGVQYKPYENTSTQIFYISLGINMFKKDDK